MNKENNSRRNFLKTTSLGSLLVWNSPEILAPSAEHSSNKITLSKDDVILFQGDSITDAGRKRENIDANSISALGSGYAFLVASALLNSYSDKNLQIYNRGISGNKVLHLKDRWDKDCLALKPNVLSILIGVNDFWQAHLGKFYGTSKIYLDDFTTLLDKTKQKLPDVKLILAEPFAVKGLKSVDDSWFPKFNEYREAAHEVAKKFGAAYIPYQSVFDNAQKTAPASYWTKDGVHPGIAGGELMAKAWLETIKG